MRNRSNLRSIGERDNIAVVATGVDLWHGAASAISIPPSAGEQMQVFSNDSEDAAGGTGIQEVLIHYLDSSGVTQLETVTTNGGAVDTIATDMMFIQDVHTTKVGSNGVAVGNVDIRSKATPSNVFNMIDAGGNMSLTIAKMVPANKTLYVTQWAASATGKQRVTMRLRSTDHHNVLYDGGSPVFLFKDTVNLENSSYTKRWEQDEWFPIPALSIIKVSAWTSQSGAYISASWGGIMVDNT